MLKLFGMNFSKRTIKKYHLTLSFDSDPIVTRSYRMTFTLLVILSKTALRLKSKTASCMQHGSWLLVGFAHIGTC
jgi:hypothetical protein